MDYDNQKKQLEDAIRQGDGKLSAPEMKKLTDYYSSFVSSGPQSQGTDVTQPGWFQSTVQATAKPFLKVATSLGTGLAEAGARLAGNDSFGDAIHTKANEEGVDYGYLGKVKPIGADAIVSMDRGGNPLKAAAQVGADAVGTGAEMSSYLLAPTEMPQGGFWKTILNSPKLAAPFAGSMAAGKGLQDLGEGKGAGEAALDTAGTYLGTSLAYGLFDGGARLMSNWGAKALSSDAVRQGGTIFKSLAEKTWNALPEAFQGKTLDMAKVLTGRSQKIAYNALKDEFEQNFKGASNAIIDAVHPEVADPQVTLGNFQRRIGETIGQDFRSKEDLYKKIDADPTPISQWSVSHGKLSEIESKAGPSMTNAEINALPTDERVAAIQKMTNEKPSILGAFSADMRRAIGFDGNPKPMTLGQILDTYQHSMSYLPEANPEEKNLIRSFANGLYNDARKTLSGSNPQLLDTWTKAYQQWKIATEKYDSSSINALKNVGDIDQYARKMVNNKLTAPESKVVEQAMSEDKGGIQNVFIGSVLRLARDEKVPADGAKLIDSFVDNWGHILEPGQTKQLDDLSHFMKGDFDSFVVGMRKMADLDAPAVEGEVPKQPELTPEIAPEKLQEQQTKVDVGKYINDNNYQTLIDHVASIKDPDKLLSTLKAMSPDEQKIVGVAKLHDLLAEETPMLKINEDKSFDISKYGDLVKGVIKSVNDLGGKNKEEVGKMLFSPETMTALQELDKTLNAIDNLNKANVSQFRSLLHGIIGVAYGVAGHPIGAANHLGQAAPGVDVKAIDQIVSDLETLLPEGGKNKRMKVGDFTQKLAPWLTRATEKGAEGLIDEVNQ